jgi:hypothetical protein
MPDDIIDDSLYGANKTRREASLNQEKIDFPYERSIYIKGILAILFSISIFGFMVGLYFLNIALKRSSESLRDHKTFPRKYKESSLKKVKFGRRMAFIALFIWIGGIVAFLTIYN